MTKTNETTRQILKFLFENNVYAFRNSVGGGSASYTTKSGLTRNRFIQFGKSGSSDIFAILPPDGKFLGIEIKTGKDRLRNEQIGFMENIKQMGGQTFVVKTYEDFLQQWTLLKKA